MEHYDYQIPPNYHRFDAFLNDWYTIPRKYQFKSFLGRGTQGCVALAYDTLREIDVAIKKIHLPEDLMARPPFRRAYRELFCMTHISHPNIVKFYDAFTPYQSAAEMREFYIVREYVDGTMARLPYGELTHEHVQNIVHDLCRGIDHLNKLGISHRDLKPTNILIGQDATVKLCDFGQSNVTDPFMGNTPYIIMRYYRAPEIVCHIKGFDNKKVDIWSIGCIFAQLLTGRVLFPGTDHVDQFRRFGSLLGSPPRSFYDTMDNHVRQYLENTVQYPGRNFEDIFPNDVFLPCYREDPDLCKHARDLLSKMLVIDPRERLAIDRVFEHPYIREFSDEFTDDDLVMFTRFREGYRWEQYLDAATNRDEIFNILQNCMNGDNYLPQF